MQLMLVEASCLRPSIGDLVAFDADAFVLDDIVSWNEPQGNVQRVVRPLFGSANDHFRRTQRSAFCLPVNDNARRNHGGNRANDYKKHLQSFLLCVGSFYFAQQFCPTKGDFFLRGIGL